MMGSTEFNIGLANERSSSRVLNPPGGRSNIFGGSDEEKPKGKAYNRNHNTEIKNCFQFEEPVTEKLTPMEEKPEKAESQEKEETDYKQVEQHVVEAAPEEKKTEPKAQPTPQRVRVPPGGFSSGLW